MELKALQWNKLPILLVTFSKNTSSIHPVVKNYTKILHSRTNHNKFNYNHPAGPLCPLKGITPGNLGKPCPLCLYSSSGVCEEPVAWLLEYEELLRRGSLEEMPCPAVVTLSSVVEGVSVEATACVWRTVSTDSCWLCVFSWRFIIWVTSGTRVGTLEARFSTWDT